MSTICKCDAGFGNTGTPSCVPLISITKGLYFVNTFKADGTKNFIDPTVTINNTFVTAKINNADVTQRWFPLYGFENVTTERADNEIETTASGKIFKTREGIRNFLGELYLQPTQLVNAIDAGQCVQMSVYIIDDAGNIIGMDKGDGKLYPIKLQQGSLDAKYVWKTDTTQSKISISFNWELSELDGQISMIAASDIATDVDFSSYKGLLDITANYSAITVNGFTATLSTKFGSMKSPIKDSGLLLADFAVAEVSPTPGAVALTSVTETPAGSGTYVYVFTTPQTIGDVLRLTPTKNGRDYKAVVANTITI